VVMITPSSNLTGLILNKWQSILGTASVCTIVNRSTTYSITFAAAGTSNVSLGTGCVILPNTSMAFVWDEYDNLWSALLQPAQGSGLASSVSYKPTDPTGTTSTSRLMMGLGSTCTFTPDATGIVHVTVSGGLVNTTAGDGVYLSGQYGTGTAPINGAALTGTAWGVGADGDAHFKSNSGAELVPFSFTQVITGLAVGTAVWFDLALATDAGGTTAQVSNVTYTLIELAQ
jgi:hypothetical protein